MPKLTRKQLGGLTREQLDDLLGLPHRRMLNHAVGGRTPIGYWRSEREPYLPDPADSIDHGWSPRERRAVLAHLRRGRVLKRWRGYSPCRICTVESNGGTCLGDSKYNWPKGLAHYIEVHGVKPDTAFIEHVLMRLEIR